MGGLAVKVTVGPSRHANAPHPSSREGHHATARWSSIFLLLDLILHGFHAAAAACSRVSPARLLRSLTQLTAQRHELSTNPGRKEGQSLDLPDRQRRPPQGRVDRHRLAAADLVFATAIPDRTQRRGRST